MNCFDIHSHKPSPRTVVSLSATGDESLPPEGTLFSVGIHPWDSATCTDTEHLYRMAALPGCVMIGEAGIDKLRGASVSIQKELLKTHIQLSEQLQKPLLQHIVKATDEIIALHKELRPEMPWIWHGFRGNAHTAEMLLKRGFYLSIGERFNADAVAAIPDDRLLVETDCSRLTIQDIVRNVAETRHDTPAHLAEITSQNARTLLGKVCL